MDKKGKEKRLLPNKRNNSRSNTNTCCLFCRPYSPIQRICFEWNLARKYVTCSLFSQYTLWTLSRLIRPIPISITRNNAKYPQILSVQSVLFFTFWMSKLMSETNELVDYNEEEDNQVPAVPLQESQEATSKWGVFGWDKSQGSLCWSGRFWVPILFLEGRNHEGDIGVWIWASLWGHFLILRVIF